MTNTIGVKQEWNIWIFPCFLCMILFGCGPAMPKTVPVSGKVTWHGKPLPDGLVAFIPTKFGEGQPLRSASGEIGVDGSYQLTSYRAGDGAPPGEYRVTVTSYSSRPHRGDLVEKPFISRIPERYGRPAESGLVFTVSTDGDSPLEFNIDLQ